MLKSNLVKALCLTSLLVLPISSAVAIEEEPIYGSQLMTQQELQSHRQKMQAAKTPEERARIRQENHEKMRLRAEEKGIDLPDNPPAEPGQMNQQNSPGSGMGPGTTSGMSSDTSTPIYGSQLMTQQERQLHRQKMQAAKTPEERARIRQENHERMRLRAEEKGIDLPDNSPAERGQMNQQNRPGSGMGPGTGSGMGPGKGPGKAPGTSSRMGSAMNSDTSTPIYGSQLMTQQERQQHRQKIQAAKTPEERARIRQENHEKMRLRAEEKGIDLPDNSPAESDEMNQQNRPGPDMDSGMGSGGNR